MVHTSVSPYQSPSDLGHRYFHLPLRFGSFASLQSACGKSSFRLNRYQRTFAAIVWFTQHQRSLEAYGASEFLRLTTPRSH